MKMIRLKCRSVNEFQSNLLALSVMLALSVSGVVSASGGVSMWKYETDRVDQERNADVFQNAPMISDVSLVRGSSGVFLDFSCAKEMYWRHHTCAETEVFTRDDINYRIRSIPDLGTVQIITKVPDEGFNIQDLVMVSSRVEYDSEGNLMDIKFPDDALEEQKAELTGTLGAVFQKLADGSNSLLSLMGDNATVLLNTNADGVLFRVYGTHALKEVFEMWIPTQGEVSVTLLSSPSDHLTESLGEKRKLRVIALAESDKVSLTTAATDYLKSVAKEFDVGELRHKAEKLGRVGESGIYDSGVYSDTLTNTLRSKYGTGIQDVVLGASGTHNVYVLAKSDAMSAATPGELWGQLRTMHSLAPDRTTFKLPEAVYNIAREDKNFEKFNDVVQKDVDADSLSHDNTKNYIVLDNDANAESSYRYAGHNALAFMNGALIGAVIHSGLDIHDRYKRDGVLPHEYSDEEFRDFAKTTAGKGLRGGLGAVATFNLSRKIPCLFAGTVVGMGNTMYEYYQKGDLDKLNLGDVAHIGAESLFSSAGAWVGAGVSAYVPLPAASTLGTLGGSIIGYYLYDYAVNNPIDWDSYFFLSE